VALLHGSTRLGKLGLARLGLSPQPHGSRLATHEPLTNLVDADPPKRSGQIQPRSLNLVDADFEELRPALAGDEEAPALGVVRESVEYEVVGGW